MSDKLSNLPDGVANGALFYAVDAGVSSKVTGGAANGVATLDAGGKVPSNLLPALGVSYQGLWNASTNTPTLANGVGTAGDFYFVSVAGSQNLGSGVIAFDVNDRVIYEGGVWENAPAHAGVQTVNAKPGPDVVLTATDVGAVAVRPPSEHSFVYGRNNAGLEQPVPWSQGADGFTLAMREIGGQITTAAPVDPTDAATKAYVDAQVAAVDPAPAWGVITGTLADQTDLHNAIVAKADATDLATHIANVAVGAHVPTGGTSGQVLTRGAGAAAAWAALTKAQVGLGNVDDTADLQKPISTATQAALTAKANAADLTTHIAQTGAATHLPPGGTPGQIPIKGAGAAVAWGDAPSGGGGAVTSVNGKTGVVLLDPDDVGAVSQAVAPNQVYTTDGSAQQSSLDFNPAGDVTNGGVAVYTGAGRLKAVDPAVAGDVATKGYVDTVDATKLPLAGGTLSGLLDVVINADGPKIILAKKLPGTQNDAPTAMGEAATYLHLGGGEWGGNSFRLLGLGYKAALTDQPPAAIGYQETQTSSNTKGDLILAVRPTNTNVAPTIILRVRSDGQVLLEDAAYVPTADGSVATKKYVDTHPGVGSGVPTTTQSSRVYVTTGTGEQSQIPYSSGAPEAGAMVQYDTAARIFTAAPTDGSHATNKTYVDNAVSSGVTVPPHVIAGGSTTFGIDGTTPETIYVDGSAAGKQITIDEANTPVGKKFTFIRKDDTPANTVTLDVEVGSTLNTSGTPGGTSTGLDTQYLVKQFWKVEANVWIWR